jgi:hypothetical protein
LAGFLVLFGRECTKDLTKTSEFCFIFLIFNRRKSFRKRSGALGFGRRDTKDTKYTKTEHEYTEPVSSELRCFILFND